MTQALAPASPPARSVADLHARFLDAPAASRHDTTALVVAAPDRVTLDLPTGTAWGLALLALVGLYTLWTTARDWCADTYTTLRARRGRE